MSETFKILRDTEMLDKFIKYLELNKNDIKDVLCIIRTRDGKLNSFIEDIPFETLCVMGKLIDYEIYTMQLPEFEDTDEDDELDEELDS